MVEINLFIIVSIWFGNKFVLQRYTKKETKVAFARRPTGGLFFYAGKKHNRWFWGVFRGGQDIWPEIVLSAAKGSFGVKKVETPWKNPEKSPIIYFACMHTKNNITNFQNQHHICNFFVPLRSNSDEYRISVYLFICLTLFLTGSWPPSVSLLGAC